MDKKRRKIQSEADHHPRESPDHGQAHQNMPHSGVQTFLLFPGSCHVTPPRNHSLAIPALAGRGIYISNIRKSDSMVSNEGAGDIERNV
ncbi:MAG: hypothetical protein ACPHF4_14930, partial [Rubripirellula sp.]